MVAMPPWPRSSRRRYRPPRTLPISVTLCSSPLVASRLTGRPEASYRTVPAPPGGSEVQRAEVFPEVVRELGPRERQLDGRTKPAHRGARVVPLALEGVAVDRLLVHERLDPVRQLDLAACAPLGLFELVEDLGREHVSPDDGEVRRRRPRIRLLDQRAQP